MLRSGIQACGAAFTVALVLCVAAEASARCCPFCAATSQTLSEEMTAADAVILAELVEAVKPETLLGTGDANSPDESTGTGVRGESKFKVVDIIKGKQFVNQAKPVMALHFGDAKPGSLFLMTGMALPDVKWATPIPLSKEAATYVGKLLGLPEKGDDRLFFFQRYLENKDSMLAQDAYDEFARAPYSEVRELKSRMDREQLKKWIKDFNISPSHRRLYLTMLSVCGTTADLPMLEEMMQAKDRRAKAGLDAMIACYLTLQGPEGMALVEDLFLKNKKAEYADTYAAIMAIRFHGQESDAIPRKRLLAGLRHMLDRPELADLVIPDLARWEDWSVFDRLVELFKKADDSSSWVRVPVINYLQACSRQDGKLGEKAKDAIDELALVDPAAVKQAKSFAAFGALIGSKPPASKPSPEGDEKVADEGKDEPSETSNKTSTDEQPTKSGTAGDSANAVAPKPKAAAAQPQKKQTSKRVKPRTNTSSASPKRTLDKQASLSEGAPPAQAAAAVPATIDPNKAGMMLILVGVVLVGLRCVSQMRAARPLSEEV